MLSEKIKNYKDKEMKTINYQCFILPYEIFNFFLHQSQGEIYMYVLTENDNMVNIIIPSSIEHNRIVKGDYTIVLSSQIIAEKEMKQSDFNNGYPDSLFCQVGGFSNNVLSESWLYSLKIATNEYLNKTWKAIEKDLKKMMLKGGYSVFTPNMARKPSKALRYTPNVYEEYKRGVLCQPNTGKNIYFELGI